ncbi:MAG TPA: hypothetical protein VFU02_14100 [Polyangiaceae bacterium]|nr:hypothetical protein [Polyangiaceae bacterium]
MSAPKRLLEDPETAAALRTDLQMVASHQVSFDVAAGLARLEASLAAGSAAAVVTAKPSLTLLKLGIAGVVAGGAVLGVVLFSGNQSNPDAPATAVSAPLVNPVPRPTTPASATSPSAAPEAALPETAAPVTEAPAPSGAQKPAGPTARQSHKPTPKPVALPVESRDDLLQREVQQLRQIRQLVGSNPGQALALANEGHSTFKGGVLYQEREALALQALSALGRRSELQARGERYLRAFPNSSFSTRVRQLLGR